MNVLAKIIARQHAYQADLRHRCISTASAVLAKDLYTKNARNWLLPLCGKCKKDDKTSWLFHTSRDDIFKPPVIGTAMATVGSGSACQASGQDFRSSGVDEAEISKFSAMASDWWDPRGSMAPLHSMNPTRVKFCRQAFCNHFNRSLTEATPLEGLRIADIGSGGGLLSESLARLGGAVTGVDASREAIGAAKMHAQGDESLHSLLDYRQGTAEELQSKGMSFDGVIASEVIEHVPDPEGFCSALAGLSRRPEAGEEPQGLVIISTLNRTPRSYALAVLAAERLLGMLPVGTHDWDKFITPEELVMIMDSQGMELDQVQGMAFSPFQGTWSLTSDLAVNYIAAFRHKQ